MTEDFITERRYLKNVSAKTLLWYHDSFHAFSGALESRATVIQRITELRQRGILAVSVNSWVRCINAYFNWLHAEHGKEQIKIPRLKEEQKILATLSTKHVSSLLSFKPMTASEKRCHAITCTLLDTGLRISECLGLLKTDVDFDNLVLKVQGKGSKQRLVPISLELRKRLFRYGSKHEHRFMFSTRNGTRMTVRNFERDLGKLCRKLKIEGVRCSGSSDSVCCPCLTMAKPPSRMEAP